MLSRTADNLFWMARYVERAENMARILDVGYRMGQLPQQVDSDDTALWQPALTIAGQFPAFSKKYSTISTGSVIAYMALDPDNPASIFTCLSNARENARAERNAITAEMFESINATWLEIKELSYANVVETGFREFFEWVKERSHLFRGVTLGTMLQGEAFTFNRLGTFIERGDNTARLLDVKHHMLAPEKESVDEAVDYYQWGALLRSLSAFKAYRSTYRDTIRARSVAELLVLNNDFPRSLHHCMGVVADLLAAVAPKAESTRRAGEIHARLHYGQISDINRSGLHTFLTEFIENNAAVTEQIAKDFLLRPA